MRTRASISLLAALLFAAGCQQTSTSTSESGTSSSATATRGTPAETAPAPSGISAAATPAGFDMSTDKSMEVAVEGARTVQLQYKDLKVGDGSIAQNGKVAMVHYTGWLTDGIKFDSSLDRGQPLQFRIGEGAMVQGWEKGILGMRVGGKRRLVIPSDLGYGDAGRGSVIPPKATLVFEMELVGLQ